MTTRGIPTVSLGCGQANPHTPQERLDLVQFWRACQAAIHLATGSSPSDLLLPAPMA